MACVSVYVQGGLCEEVWGCSCILEVDVWVQACVRMLVELCRAVGVYMGVHKRTRAERCLC